ncbi:hypothetical protein GLE_2875 [Lysobacter enzymogenes]|uniref:Uncharacterized protein n=1 Tax=Lysobacter enzymogenes TaxID=69 RepID=A0A0S2DIY4_LYSEN|nr:DUF1249 domain-containing protein [Lysobacter enzymogenes]ALN58223.1 hypothetical protein GLE_2875 [Lysobacter enzymogenes]QCW26660.1 DUF1249 domain-containing protein [Lysobacter enzymogenes]UZW63015.1 DUF1249 domain-containing protein [Lysobacter enzymogenes]
MTQAASRFARIPKLSRFGWLMGLYAENHERLTRMFEPAGLARGTYLSQVGDGLDLRLDVLEQHRYTTELRLTYAMQDPLTGEPDPSAYVRLYHDAHQVEATHCYVGRRWQDAIGMYPPPAQVLGHRMRMNTFLGKWLEYLAERGHGMTRLRPVELDPSPSDPNEDDPRGAGHDGAAKNSAMNA